MATNILNYSEFSESISGTEMIGSMGPNYGEPALGMPIPSGDVTLLFCSVDDKMYTKEEYDELYKKYLSGGGEPLYGYSKANLDKVVMHLSEQ